MGILIASITNNQILYYFFSNNYMNLIILNLYNNIEINDSDIISYYINFLKSISMKLEKNIIKLFYNEKTNFFPLLDIIMTLYNHQDEMIKNVSRNIFLSIIKLNYEPSIDYICNLPQINYFILFMNKIENLIKNLFDIKNNSTNDKKDNKSKIEKIKEIIEEITNDIYFIQDIYSVGNNKINYILTNCLFYQIIIKLLFKNIINHNNLETSLYLLFLFFKNIKNETFLNLLVYLLYSEQIHYKINDIIMNNDSFFENINNFYLHYIKIKFSFEDFIMFNYDINFFKSFDSLEKNYIYYNEIKKIIQLLNNYHKIFGEKNVENFILAELNKIFLSKQNFIEKFKKYHKIMSNITGINLGMSLNDFKDSFLQLINESFNDNNNEILQNNIIRKKILNIFNNNNNYYVKNKNIFVNNLYLLYNIINSSKISEKLKIFLKLHSITDINLNIKNNENEQNQQKINQNKTENNIFIDINSLNFNNDFKKINDSEISYHKSSFDNFDNFENLTMPNNSTNLKINFSQIFDNNYFSNKFNELFQNNYDSILIQNLFKNIQNNKTIFLNSLSIRILFNILETLIVTKNNFQINENDLSNINEKYIEILHEIFGVLSKNKNLGNEVIKNCFEIFYNQFEFNKQNLNLILAELVEEPYLIYPENNLDILKIPSNENEKFESLILIFLNLYDLRLLLLKKNIPLLKNSIFPLKIIDKKFSIGEQINLSNLKIDVYNCKFKLNFYDKNEFKYQLFIYQNYLYFIDNLKDKKDISVIKYKYPIRNIFVMNDRGEPRLLTLFINDSSIFLTFTDPKKTIEINNVINNNKKNTLEYEYTIFTSYISNLIKEYYN